MFKAFLLALTVSFYATAVAGAQTARVVWQPLEKQSREPDTLYLLDVDAERKLTPGDGGMIPCQPGEQPWTKLVPCEGKYRTGLKCLDRRYGFMWLPSIGLIAPDQFTVEAWFLGEAPWSEGPEGSLLAILDERGANRFQLRVYRGELTLEYGHQQDPRGPVRASLRYDFKQHPVPAGRWLSLAVTYKADTLTLYVDGKQVGQQAELPPPRLWSDASRGDGLSLLGAAGYGCPGYAISDLRISRFARTPGEPVEVTDENRLVVEPQQATGQIVRQTLLGALHTLAGPETEAMAKGALHVLRTDKLLVVTPIKAGPPDEQHPAAGISGRYSYDWQVVDRTFDYYQRLDIVPYISIDATPQLLGGSVQPFSGQALRAQRSYASGFPRQVPADWEAFGQIVRDLVHHVVNEKRYDVPRWGVWNEPNGNDFWNNSLEDYLRLYEVCVRAVKSVDANLRVGGPETGDFDRRWVEGLIRHCGQKQLPLDFISWHYYQSTVVEIPYVRAMVDYWAGQYGVPGPVELVNGEWCWQIHNFPKTGYLPWRERNYYVNDWHAAFTAASLIEMQRAGVVYGIYTNAVQTGDASFDASGLMAPNHPWANLNVFRLWSKLAPTLIATRYEGQPGVFALASRDDHGRLTVLLAHLRYRKDVTASVTLQVSGLERAKITHYVVDDQHSNHFDAGPTHAELEAVDPPVCVKGQAEVALRPRSVHLLVFEVGR